MRIIFYFDREEFRNFRISKHLGDTSEIFIKNMISFVEVQKSRRLIRDKILYVNKKNINISGI